MAHMAAAMWAAGGTLGLVALAFPRPAGTSLAVAMVPPVLAYAVVGLLVTAGRRLPLWTFQLLTALGSVAIAVVVAATAGAGDAYAMLFLWVGLYSVYFFTPRAIAVQLAILSVAAGTAFTANGGVVDVQAHLVMLTGTLVGSSTWMRLLVRQRNRRLHFLSLLQRTARVLGPCLDLTTVLAEVTRSAALVISPSGDGGARASVFRVAAGQGELVADFDTTGADLEGIRFPLASHPMVARVVSSQQRCAGPLPVDELGPELGPLARSQGLATGCWAPLWAQGRLYGVLAVISRRPRRWTDEETEAVAGIADLAGIAINNALTYATEQGTVHRLHALLGANLTLTQESDPDLVLARIIDVARELVEAEFGALCVLSAAHDRLTTVAHSGLPAATVAEAEASLRGGAGQLMALNRPVRLADLCGHPLAASLPASYPSIGSFLAVPLRYRGCGLGTLFLANKGGERAFTSGDEDAIVGLAAQAAIAIENARALTVISAAAASDPLTGLRNRRGFERALRTQTGRRFSLLAIDVDDLKPINDQYGHEAGDVVLRAVASVLDHSVRGDDVVARVGGDEFAVLLPGAGPGQAGVIADRMCDTMRGMAVSYGQVKISVGHASTLEGDDALDVWRAADAALYEAKHGGRDRVVAARAGSPSSPGHGTELSSTLARLLDGSGVRSVYQPIVRLDGRATVGFEALARPAGGDAGEGVERLFATAHRLGRARDLDWLCRRAAVDCSAALPLGTPLFINISVVSLLDPVHGVDQMMMLLEWANRPPADTVLEITEREAISDLARLRLVLAAYREHGVRFALDDIGEGHSTLEVLAVALPEYLKIARSLTASASDPGSVAAIRAIVSFATAMDAEVVAEGIETEEQAVRMAELGVGLGQGFWLGPPLEAAHHGAVSTTTGRDARDGVTGMAAASTGGG